MLHGIINASRECRQTHSKLLFGFRSGFFTLSLLGATSALAGGPVTTVDSHFEQTTPFQYEANGVSYLWGVGQNQVLDGFYFNGHHHSEISAADTVNIQRVDIPGVATGEPCGVFAEYDGNVDELVAGYPQGATGNCDMASMLSGRVINRGTLDTFTNTGPAPKNIERIDFVYANGLLTSLSDGGLDVSGHIVAEKRGNNPLQMAAITGLDSLGEPSSYGPLVRVSAAGCSAPEICYGVTAIRHEYSFLQSASIAPQNFATRLSGDTENMAMAFISSRDLGLSSNQRYFGFSLFARDVDAATHNLLDPASFPSDSADDYIVLGDGADLYGGMASSYWDDNAPSDTVGQAIVGNAFIDQNDNGERDDSDVGLGGVDITLYEDTDGNRMFDAAIDQQLMSTTTDSTGRFVFPGVTDGFYFAELDENSDAIPAGVAVVDGSNPVGFDVDSGAVTDLNFAFISIANDGAVNAAADEVSIRQDTQTVIDVLANDSDPVGGGLSISAISAASNGNVVINGDQISYTPNAGFNGNDSFSYTVADVNGGESTATVSVKVLRFSDINNNGIDDYIECDCDDIRLLTGIHGSGVGGGNGLWLLALAPLLRARRIFKHRQGVSA